MKQKAYRSKSFRLSLEVVDILKKENGRTGIPQTRLVEDAVMAAYGGIPIDDSGIDPGPIPERTTL